MTARTAPGRSCGKCSLCCNMLAVAEIDKPANVWCKHCQPGRAEGGCTIHESRPTICRGYYCGWLLSSTVGDEWYPLRSRMILSLAPIDNVLTCTVTVDPRFPGMWKQRPYYEQLKQMAHSGLRVASAAEILLVMVRCNGRVWLLMDDADVEVTHRFYIAKFVGSGQPAAIELLDTLEQAQERVAALTNVLGRPPAAVTSRRSDG